ncbi:MAG: PG0541 family transporter-associated protein [Lentisphaeria bacterium]
MKMIFIVFNISIQEEVHDAIDKLGVTCFTQWPRLIGKGISSGPKMDNNVWPGANTALLIVSADDMAEKIMDTVQKLRDDIGTHEGIKAFQLPVEKMTGEI